jgi:hypothetical protein
MKRLVNKKGQGTMEYILIAAMLVGVLLYLYKTVKPGMTKNIDSVAAGLNTPSN